MKQIIYGILAGAGAMVLAIYVGSPKEKQIFKKETLKLNLTGRFVVKFNDISVGHPNESRHYNYFNNQGEMKAWGRTIDMYYGDYIIRDSAIFLGNDAFGDALRNERDTALSQFTLIRK